MSINFKDLEPMFQELKNIVGSISGVKSLQETLSISMIAEVETEEQAESVEKVAAVLTSQAEKYGIVLEITPATTKEIEEAKQRYAEFLGSQTKFKA